MPASSSRMAGAILVRRATSAVPARTASRIRKIWNLASSMPSHSPGSGAEVNARTIPTERAPLRFQPLPDIFVTCRRIPAENRASPGPVSAGARRRQRAGSITMKRIGEHAVVIGASMAGLLAARALADFYDRVTVLERDAFPVADIPRKGVPQGRHAHGLLARGRSVIESFFPGWTDEVVATGGVRGDIAGDVNWIGHGVTIKSAPSDLIGLLASRPALEGHVRRRLLALPNVRRMIEGCAVQGLVASDDNATVRGVHVRIGRHRTGDRSGSRGGCIRARLVRARPGSRISAIHAACGREDRDRHRLHDTRLSPPSRRSRRAGCRGHRRQRSELAQWRRALPDRGSLDRLDRRLFRRSCARR